MIQHLETDARLIKQKDNLPLPHQMRRLRHPQKGSSSRGQSPSKKGTFPCRYREECTNLSCSYGHPLVCQNYRSETGCKCGKFCDFRHVDAEEKKPSKKSKKGSVIGSVGSLKETIQLGCVSQDSYPRTSISRKEEQVESKHAVKFSKGTWHQMKIRERKGPSRGIIQKREPHERSPCAPGFAKRSQDETSEQERCARRAKNTDKATFYSLIEMKARPAPILNLPEEREIVVDSGASMHMLSKGIQV